MILQRRIDESISSQIAENPQASCFPSGIGWGASLPIRLWFMQLKDFIQ
jgi:hypothetical protein